MSIYICLDINVSKLIGNESLTVHDLYQYKIILLCITIYTISTQTYQTSYPSHTYPLQYTKPQLILKYMQFNRRDSLVPDEQDSATLLQVGISVSSQKGLKRPDITLGGWRMIVHRGIYSKALVFYYHASHHQSHPITITH